MFKIVRLSTIKFINDNLPAGTTYVDWDGSSDITKLPAGDLVGLHAFAIANEGKLFNVTFGVTLAVADDPNLFRMADYVDLYYGLMMPEREFTIYDSTGAAVAKALFSDGATVHPVTRFESRVAQSIQASAEITITR